jgi:hypothetical protein
MALPATQMRLGMIIKLNHQLQLVFKVEHRAPDILLRNSRLSELAMNS